MPADPAALDLDLRGALLPTPTWYPQKIDIAAQRALFIRMSEADYRKSSFLDDRMLGPGVEGAWVDLNALAEALRGAAPINPVHFIFHTGHVGSTLVSRLLDETSRVVGLREPLPLRSLAEAHDRLGRLDSIVSQPAFAALVSQQVVLWSRPFPGAVASVVKATSTSGRLAGYLLALRPDAKALYLALRLEPHLATLLSGENSAADLRSFAGERMRRLVDLGISPPRPVHEMSPGELAALAWVAEGVSRSRAAAGGRRVLLMDFDEFLADVGQGMGAVLSHFGLPADPARLAGVAQSPTLNRYSKAPEHAYSPSLRADVLNETRANMQGEIRRGLEWTDALAKLSPEVAALL